MEKYTLSELIDFMESYKKLYAELKHFEGFETTKEDESKFGAVIEQLSRLKDLTQ